MTNCDGVVTKALTAFSSLGHPQQEQSREGYRDNVDGMTKTKERFLSTYSNGGSKPSNGYRSYTKSGNTGGYSTSRTKSSGSSHGSYGSRSSNSSYNKKTTKSKYGSSTNKSSAYSSSKNSGSGSSGGGGWFGWLGKKKESSPSKYSSYGTSSYGTTGSYGSSSSYKKSSSSRYHPGYDNEGSVDYHVLFVLLFVLFCLSVGLMFYTAHEFANNPEGNFANCCRLSLNTLDCTGRLCYNLYQCRLGEVLGILCPGDDDDNDDYTDEELQRMTLRPGIGRALDVEHGKAMKKLTMEMSRSRMREQ